MNAAVIGGLNIYDYNTMVTRQATATALRKSTATSEAYVTATANVIATSQVYATATADVTANATATFVARSNATAQSVISHYPFGNVFLLRDLFPGIKNDNVHWDEKKPGCQREGSAYAVSLPSNANFLACFVNTSVNFDDFTYEIQIHLSGDCAGITFRADTIMQNFYVFMVCQNGKYIWGDVNHGELNILTTTQNSSIVSGDNPVNTLAVVAQGCNFKIYVNYTSEPVYEATQCDYIEGQIGTIVYAWSNKDSTQALFFHAKVWKLQAPT